jgi:hypothetical protein
MTGANKVGCALFALALVFSAVFADCEEGPSASPSESPQSEDIDSLFGSSAEPSQEAQPSRDPVAALETESGIKVSGTYSTYAAASIGWTNTSGLGTGFADSYGFYSVYDVVIEARPSADLSIRATSEAYLGGSSLSIIPQISFTSLYLDYAPLPWAYFRAGRFEFSWGQDKILYPSPDNLVAASSSGISLRASFPEILSGLSFVVITPSAFDSSQPFASQLRYCASLDEVLGPCLFSLSTSFLYSEGLRAQLGLKVVVFGIDLFAEGQLRTNGVDLYPQALAGAYWEAADGSLKLYAEYWYNGENPSGADQVLGAVAGFNNLFGSPLDLGLSWYHAFLDGSGFLLAGLQWKPLPLMTVDFGLLDQYGPITAGRVYAVQDKVGADGAGRQLSLILKITVSGAF